MEHTAHESVPIEPMEGNEFTVSLNYKFMLDALKALDDEHDLAIIRFDSPNRPLKITGFSDETCLQVISPYISA